MCYVPVPRPGVCPGCGTCKTCGSTPKIVKQPAINRPRPDLSGFQYGQWYR